MHQKSHVYRKRSNAWASWLDYKDPAPDREQWCFKKFEREPLMLLGAMRGMNRFAFVGKVEVSCDMEPVHQT